MTMTDTSARMRWWARIASVTAFASAASSAVQLIPTTRSMAYDAHTLVCEMQWAVRNTMASDSIGSQTSMYAGSPSGPPRATSSRSSWKKLRASRTLKWLRHASLAAPYKSGSPEKVSTSGPSTTAASLRSFAMRRSAADSSSSSASARFVAKTRTRRVFGDPNRPSLWCAWCASTRAAWVCSTISVGDIGSSTDGRWCG
mmetsp:Transcript_40825/g.126052  ORF Transcript_40825/g.126052 Transcript_40825/m.126052 type:complete len:200 (-) Transcript_40825:404-1003(-)